ncbi:MAG: bifunctional folylpolyglutamate synthase/dihydrofolate synthase [Candidatus Latescibacterota bacterium]|nr:MAG: bifunctional folylpolyglutamate synthase/dihydrofolate synthase [Candidatus Latescibacterota bacterium]
MRRTPPQSLDGPPQLPPNLSFVLNLSPSAMTLGLANMRKLLDALGHPERGFDSVIIAGTNGKGSVSSYLAAILRTHGLRVGLYTSPHIYSVNERITIDGDPVSIDRMEAAAARIAPLYDSIGYSYFEALTAIAYLAFDESGVEIAVLETGLGGRFDATNVVEPRVSVLTGISLDHRRILGDTEEEILREKLGITRPRVPLVCGVLPPDLRQIVEDKADREKIPLCMTQDTGSAEPRRQSFEGASAAIQTETQDYGDIPLPFLGTHQLGNALVAVRTAEFLVDPLDRLNAAAGLVYMPGRFEVVPFAGKTMVLDVAHNDQALTAAVKTLESLSPREENAMILGILRRKELQGFPREIAAHVGGLVLVESVVGESHTAPQLLQRIGLENCAQKSLNVTLESPLASERMVVNLVRRLTSETSLFNAFLITGSHRTVEVFGRALHRLEAN